MNLGQQYINPDKKKIAQKLKHYEKCKGLKFPLWVSEKYDGVFCMAFLDADKEVRIVSRTGEEYLSLEHLKVELKDDLETCSQVLFEAVVEGSGQSVASGACRDTKKQRPEVSAKVYGFIDDNDIITFTMSDAVFGNYEHVWHALVDNEEDLMTLFAAVLDKGGEGLVLTPSLKQPYERGKRNNSMVKLKQEDTYDLEVVGVVPGTPGSKYSETLGALVVRFKDITINVSGMTDKQRADWWADPSLIVGKIVEVKAMRDSANGSLREPRFKTIRHDKCEPDA